jgi:hypothetical protein
MTDPLDWEASYGEYLGYWAEVAEGIRPFRDFQPPAVAVRGVIEPTDSDARWLTGALTDEGSWPWSRKWFVGTLASGLTTLAEVLFRPMLDAAIDEINPSYNRYFVDPCMGSFGPRRVNEYLLSVVESGTDFRKAGAINALYWAQVPLSFPIDAPSFDIQYATRESRAAYEGLRDIWERKQRLFLETFVANSSVDVRRSTIPALDLDPQDYPESHRPLVTQAIEIARSHTDHFIRQGVEIQLGDVSRGLPPLPYRDKKEPSA